MAEAAAAEAAGGCRGRNQGDGHDGGEGREGESGSSGVHDDFSFMVAAHRELAGWGGASALLHFSRGSTRWQVWEALDRRWIAVGRTLFFDFVAGQSPVKRSVFQSTVIVIA
jgi:hypothetical protein